MKIPRAQARGIFAFVLVLGLVASVLLSGYAVPRVIKRFTPKVAATGLEVPPSTLQIYDADLKAALAIRLLPASEKARLASVTNRTKIYRDGCHGNQKTTIPAAPCIFGDVRATRALWLIGDSHAAQWFIPLNYLAKKHHYQLVVRTMSSCPVLTGVPVLDDPKANYWQCKAHNQWLLQQIGSRKPAFVVVSGYSGIEVKNLAATKAGLSALAGLGSKILVIGDTPKPKGSAPDCLAAHLADVRPCYASRTANQAARVRSSLADLSRKYGFNWVDPSMWLCVDQKCPPVIAKRLVYADNTHLSTETQHYLVGRIEAAFAGELEK